MDQAHECLSSWELIPSYHALVCVIVGQDVYKLVMDILDGDENAQEKFNKVLFLEAWSCKCPL